MARWRRFAPGGIVYHVLNRANNRSQIFFADSDYDLLVDLIFAAARRTGVRVLAYCVMPNHWHLLLWPIEDGTLWRFAHWLTVNHVRSYRRQTDTVGLGHVYQGRYRSFPVQTERYYYNALRYVEATAFRARLVNGAEQWRWSSAHERASATTRLAAGPLELPSDWRELVNCGLPDHDLRTLRVCAHEGRPYGSDTWVEEAAIRCGLEHTLRGRGRPREVMAGERCASCTV